MSYKLHHQPLAGESYMRCYQIVIDNRLGQPPGVVYSQERVIADQGGAVSRHPVGTLRHHYEPAATIPVIDPETGEPTGEAVTQQQLMALVYSAYIAAATATTDTEEDAE